MRTKHDEALARIKSVQDRLQKHQGPVPADTLSALFSELVGSCSELVKAAQTPAAAARRMTFGGVGDAISRKAAMIEALPREVQVAMDDAYLVAKMLRRPVSETKSWNRLIEGSSDLQKAMDTTDSSEWVPTGFSPELIKDVTQMSMIEQFHRHIVMPTNPYKVPIQAARATAYLASEQTANTSQTAYSKSSGTSIAGNLTLTAKGLAVEVLTSKELEEDSIVAILPFLRAEIVAALARGVEEACLNGDTTATHMDSDIESAGATDRRTIWKGFRKHALEQSYSVDFGATGNGFDIETFRKVRAKLGKFGVNPKDLYWILSLNTYFAALSLKDTHGNPAVLTLDKMGPDATIITGVLGMLDGAPVGVSEFSRDVLNASGVYEAGQAKSSILCVNRSGWVFGDRRDASVQVLGELYAEYGQDAVLTTMRKDFEPVFDITANPLVAIGYNI